MAFFEIRQYTILPGKMDAWLEFMETVIIPFQVSKGMVITGSFQGEEDKSVYFWFRRFESEADRERLYEAVYQSDTWKNDIAPKVPELINREGIVVQRVLATSMSTMQ
ncbi:MAG: NIPSNAP family protein [Alphaproteobacteria bacterium]|nr:NIPSNAP family protein [Alphaproteobacteria bacterium]